MRSIKYCSLSEQFLTVSVPEKNNLSWFIDNAKKAVEILLTTDNASRVIESNAASQVFTGLQDLYFRVRSLDLFEGGFKKFMVES
jgi:hypothetical protein